MSGVNWSTILTKAAESLQREGRHNQASILKDAAQAFAAQKQALEAAKKALTKAESVFDAASAPKDLWMAEKYIEAALAALEAS